MDESKIKYSNIVSTTISRKCCQYEIHWAQKKINQLRKPKSTIDYENCQLLAGHYFLI